MADNYRQLNFPGPIPAVIPQVVFGQGHRPPPPPPYGGFPPASAPPVGHHHAPASVASPAAFAASPHRPLSHEDLSSASDLTMSFPHSVGVPAAIPSAPPLVLPPVPVLGGGVSPPPVSSPAVVISPPAVSLRPSAENFKLPVLKDSKAYLDVYDMILYWLRLGVVLPPPPLLQTSTNRVKNGLCLLHGSRPTPRRVSRLGGNGPSLERVSAPFVIARRNRGTSPQTVLS